MVYEAAGDRSANRSVTIQHRAYSSPELLVFISLRWYCMCNIGSKRLVWISYYCSKGKATLNTITFINRSDIHPSESSYISWSGYLGYTVGYRLIVGSHSVVIPGPDSPSPLSGVIYGAHSQKVPRKRVQTALYCQVLNGPRLGTATRPGTLPGWSYPESEMYGAYAYFSLSSSTSFNSLRVSV